MISRIILVLVSFSLSCGSLLMGNGQDNNAAVVEQKIVEQKAAKADELNDMVSKGLNELLNINGDDILKNIMDFYQQTIAKRHEAMLKKLPEDLRNDIIEAKEIYQEFVASFNLPDCVLVICEDLRQDLDSLAQENVQSEVLEPLLRELEKLHLAVVTGQFKVLLQSIKPQGDAAWQVPFLQGFDVGSMLATMQQNLQGVDQDRLNEVYEEKDVLALHQALEACLQATTSDEHFKDLRQPMQRLYNLVTALKNKDNKALVIHTMGCLDGIFKTTHTSLSATLRKIDSAIKLAHKPEDAELKKALEFWRRDVSKYTRSLNVFASVKHHAGFRTPESTYTLFKIMTNAYRASHGLLELFKKDYRRDQRAMMLSSAMDWAFTSSLSLWFFFAQQADYLNDLVSDTVLGTKSIASLDEKQVLLYRAIAGMQALPIAYNPSVWTKPSSKIMTIAGKISTAFVYYHLFHVKLFGNKYQGLWPNTDTHLKSAMLYAFKKGKDYVSSEVISNVYWHTDPETLGNLEKWTFGIVKPELIGEAIDILFPFFFWQRYPVVDGIAHFERKDLYKGHGIDYDALRQKYDDEDAQKAHDARLDREFIERNVLDYVMSSVGMYAGTILANKYQNQIGGALKKTARGFGRVLVWMNLVSQESIDDWGYEVEDMQEEFEQILGFVKMALKNVLQEESPWRNKMIPLLQERGFLKEADTTTAKINRRLLYLVLNQLASHRLISYLEAASINRAFRKDPKNLDTTVDKVVDAIRNNVFGMAGGMVGSWGMGKLGDYAYPKVKEWMGNPVVSVD